MLNEKFIKEAEDLYQKMKSDVGEWQTNACEYVEGCEQNIIKIDHYIRQLKMIMGDRDFESTAYEIHFFRNIKPLFIAEFIFYGELLSFVASMPNSGYKFQKKHYESLLHRIDRFNKENANFVQYIKMDARHFDHFYFCRKRYDLKININEHLHSLDEKFSTFQDGNVAKIIANEKLCQYAQNKMGELSKADSPVLHVAKASWTGKKVFLVELLYSLHLTKSIHVGTGTLSDLIRFTENTFQIDLQQFHKTLAEIEMRKIDRTKFLTLLQHHLDKHFEELDGV